jgi:hypothetical protein
VLGTATAVLLLERFTDNPPLFACAFSVNVQSSVPAPVIALFVQLSALRTGTPAPLKLTAVVVITAAAPVTVSCPVAAPIAVGLNPTVSVKVPPAATVTGRLLCVLVLNDCPVTVICEILTAVVP